MIRDVWSTADESRHGAVLMEYVVLLSALLTALVLGTRVIFDPAGSVNGDFGFVGNAFVSWMDRIVETVVLPCP